MDEMSERSFKPIWRFTYLEVGALVTLFLAFLLMGACIVAAAELKSFVPAEIIGAAAMSLGMAAMVMLAADWLEERQRTRASDDLVARMKRELLAEFEIAKKRAPRRTGTRRAAKPAAE